MAFQARTHERGFVRFGEDGVEGRIDVAIGDAAGAKFTRDAKTSLAAGLGVLACVIESVAGVIEVVLLAETGDHRRDKACIFRAELKVLAHFMDGVRAAHKGAESSGVELLFGGEFLRR